MDASVAPSLALAACLLLLVVLTVVLVPAQEVHAPGDLDADFTADEQERERTFRRAVRPVSLLGAALGVLVPTVLALTPLPRDVASSTTWWLATLVLVTVVVVATRLVTLPGAIVVRRRSLAVGLATGPWSRWWRDVVVSLCLAWLTSSLASLAWVGVARALPDVWWVVLSVGAALVVVLLSFVVPVVVEPLFLRFSPLPDGALRDRLLALAVEAGVPVRDVLVADASRRTTALNAYVSGLGPTRRVVVHDTLVDRGRDDEVAAVVAHELGHVVARDVPTGTLLGALGAAAGVLGAAVLLTLPGGAALVGVDGPADPAVVVVLAALGAWVGLLTAPLQNGVSRRVERRADTFCLDLARDPGTVASMHRALAVTNLATLRPVRLLQLWFGTHPTSPERIAAARTWARRAGAPEVPPLRPTTD